MSAVFVTGANGYIGQAVAESLARKGFTVYGLVRKKESFKSLEQKEIIPVLGSLDQVDKFGDLLDKVSVLIDTVLAPKVEFTKSLLKRFEESKRNGERKKKYIYTSGILVYGDRPNEIVTENDPVGKVLEWRSKFEQDVIHSDKVNGVVVRPGFVYGGQGGKYVPPLFQCGKSGKIVVKGNPKKMWSWIHVQDLADAYVKIVEAGSNVVSGEIFNVVDDSRYTYEQVCIAMAKLATPDVKEIDHQPPDQDYFSKVALESTVLTSHHKISSLLDWSPKQKPYLENLEVYYKSYKAHQTN